MPRSSLCLALAYVLIICGLAQPGLAAGGTSIVARKGQPAYVAPSWPEGVAELVNDPARTTGWNSWFTEWPNDVNQYGFEITSIVDVNRLIEKLAAVQFTRRHIHLSYLKEPRGLGWVTQLPEGNNIPVIFSIGDQSRIDQWFKQVRKPFGKMEFIAAPVAVPPTLTIFVQHKVIDLEQLKIPDGIEVTAGYVPTVFHRANTVQEKGQEEEAALRPAPKQPDLDAQSQQAIDRITRVLDGRSRSK